MLLKGIVASLEKERVRRAVQKCFGPLHTPRFLHFHCGDPTLFSFMPKLNIKVGERDSSPFESSVLSSRT